MAQPWLLHSFPRCPMAPMNHYQSIPTQYGSNFHNIRGTAPLGYTDTYTMGPMLQGANRSQQSVPTRLTDDHHPVLLSQLTKHASVWRMIGTYLEFYPGEIANIEMRPNLIQGAPVSWLSAMLSQWLQWAPGDSRGSNRFATLEDLKRALSRAGLAAAAHDLGV